MISVYELVSATRDHKHQMDDIDGLCEALDIDHDELRIALTAVVEARDPEHNLSSKELAYKGGLLDGFMLGVKAQCAEIAAKCEGCGKGMNRLEHDPVPSDYHPDKHQIVCGACRLAAQAAMN